MFRTITINAVANGWVVKVGCQTFVFEKPESLLKDLGEYLANPVEKEKSMMEKSVNAKHTLSNIDPVQPIPGQVVPMPDQYWSNITTTTTPTPYTYGTGCDTAPGR